MNTSFRTLRDCLLLLLWGAFVLWLDLSKQLSTYLHPSLQPYTAAAGVVLLILAFFSLRALLNGTAEPHSCCHHEHTCCDGHDHEPHHADAGDEHLHEAVLESSHHHGEEKGAGMLLFKTLVLLLPLSIVVLGQSNHYTLSTITNRGVVQDLSQLPAAKVLAPESASAPPPSSTTPQAGDQQTGEGMATASASESGAMPIQVIDLLYAVQMPTYREEFEGKSAELIGQFVPMTTGNPKGNRFQVIRLFITCCAADAKPVGVTVQYDKPLKVSEMGWVKITGNPTFPMEGGRRTAVLMADKVEECPAPAEPFVY
jgi:uncharacterized repeat protein (TIGR03943 family)